MMNWFRLFEKERNRGATPHAKRTGPSPAKFNRKESGENETDEKAQ